MGVGNLVHPFGEVESCLVDSVLFWASLGHSSPGFFGAIQFNWDLQPLGCTIYSGLLIWMKVVLQDVSGGALQVVR